ncbi:MAG: ATP-binding cassette domain-containing protein [Bdellovibrionaceae bacterium]|nr:ATP-binding cassette domain-containing protein [Pseudobdellovibrionaceae bacterium]MDW8189846.1 ATP-binding cassette domain-containing protein [Pseudobdellovibrionaceae bacterium]
MNNQKQTNPSPSPIISFLQVRKSFGNNVVLKNVTLDIYPGEIIFIIGRSGSGKSVLLKHLVGLIRPDSGDIFFKAQNLSHLKENEFFPIRQKVGLIFQQPALFDSLTVYENVAFGLQRLQKRSGKELEDQINKVLATLAISDLKNRKPNTLSFGQQKRVAIARTIALNPEVLLFDEPTTGLDPVATTVVNGLIASLSRKMKTTSVVVSHDMHSAFTIADRIVILHEGEVLVGGTPAEIKQCSHPLVQEFIKEV